ncbi:MAG: thioredoxin [Candidatus Lokiarchaeota archaeon]
MSDNELEKIKMRKAEMMMKGEKSLPKKIVKVHNMNEFDALINEYPETIILIDFTAVWCGPCQMFGPIFEKLSQDYSEDFIFAKVDVDENPMVARKYSVTGVPTTAFIKGNKLVNRMVGAHGYDSMVQVLNRLREEA